MRRSLFVAIAGTLLAGCTCGGNVAVVMTGNTVGVMLNRY